MLHFLAMTYWYRNPLIIVIAATGLLFVELVVVAWRRNGTAVIDGSGQPKVIRRSRWLPISLGAVSFLVFGVGLALMHLPAIEKWILGDQKPFDRSRAQSIIEELKQQESDKVKLLMLKELEVIIDDQAKD